jgi:hypothetical protein
VETEVPLAESWNEYWRAQILQMNEYRCVGARIAHAIFAEHIIWLRERNVRRVLLPGNGCSLLPYMLKHFGFDVMVVDISSVANGYVAAQERAEVLASFPASPEILAQEARTGGHLTLVTADIREWEPDAPIDAIYDDRTLPVLPTGERPEIAARYYRWLSADGVAVCHTSNLGGGMGEPDAGKWIDVYEDAFRKAGFQEEERRESQIITRRFLFLKQIKTETTRVVPPHGKVVFFVHGSG